MCGDGDDGVLRACGADIEVLRKELQDFLDATTPLIPTSETDRETQPTLGFQRVLQRAVFHVQSSGRKEVTGASVLVAIFSEQESHAVYILKQQEVNRIDVVNFIAHGTPKVASKEEVDSAEQVDEVPPVRRKPPVTWNSLRATLMSKPERE